MMWSSPLWVLQSLVLFIAPCYITCTSSSYTTGWSSSKSSDDDNCKYYQHHQRRAQLDDRGKYNKYKYEPLDDSNIETAVEQWLNNKTGALIRFGPIEGWDVRGVSYMRNLFKGAVTFNDNIAGWDVSCVTTMHEMFMDANEFNQPITGWNVERVTNMFSMFRSATAFNQDLPWQAPDLVDMGLMFNGARSMQGDLSLFLTSNVYNMQGTFQDIDYSPDISGWDVSKVGNAVSMFENNAVFNSDIRKWNTKSLFLFERMFWNASSFNQKLCWELKKDKNIPVSSFQVFCYTDGAKFDKQCVDEDVVYDSERRCRDAVDEWAQSWIDFGQQIADFFERILEFFGCDTTCFSPDAMTPVEGKGMVAMKDLQVGDKALTGSGSYQPVYSMFHSHKNKPTSYLQIHTSHHHHHSSHNSNNTTRDHRRPLELTANHMLHVVGRDNPIPAWQVKVGDYLYVLDGEPPTTWSSGHLTGQQQQWRQTQVIQIKEIIRNGLYNPLTPDGTIVVDNILTSAYASFLGTEHIHLFRKFSTASIATSRDTTNLQEQDGWKVMSHQSFVHLLLAPYRFLCLHVSSDLCKPSASDSDENSVYGQLGQLLLLISLRQHVLVQAIMFAALVAFFGLLSMLLTPLGLSVALLFASSAVYYRKSSSLEPKRL